MWILSDCALRVKTRRRAGLGITTRTSDTTFAAISRGNCIDGSRIKIIEYVYISARQADGPPYC